MNPRQGPAAVSGTEEFGRVRAELSRVVTDHPAAVLLVDLDSRQVIYANALAAQLAPGAPLPVEVERWSLMAGLHDADGAPLGDGRGSLQRVAAGKPVSGEQVTARRGSDVSDAREDLWVIGMPLTDAPAPLNRRALVVFLPLRDRAGIDQAQQSRFELQHRAVISSEVSFSISDPYGADDPLLWVNPAFEAITGYRSAQVIGTNCRFLQGPDTDPDAVQRIRNGLAAGGTVIETLLNYRADGTAFWNHIVISPIYDADGVLTHHVGVQSDVTERVEADRERDRALASAESANMRLAALAAISAELSNGLDSGETTFAHLPAVLAGHLDGWVLTAAIDDHGTVTDLGIAHSHPDRRSGDGVGATSSEHGDALRQADLQLADVVQAALTTWLASSAARPVIDMLLTRLADAAPAAGQSTGHGPIHGVVNGPAFDAALRTLGLTGTDLIQPVGSGVIAPIMARGRRIGLLALLRDTTAAPFDDADLAAYVDLGVRVGVALDNARLYAREHSAALTLQQSLLPRLPSLEGFEVAATYQPAHNQAQVGGDWYDVLDLPSDSGVGVAIGDVMGHDLRAAAAMGQLRSVLRSYAWSGDAPAEVIARLDQLVQGLDMAALATCAYAVVCPDSDGGCAVTYTLAGHPPLLIRHPDGRIEVLDQALTSPVGVSGDSRLVPQAVTDLPAGAHLVLYTDGLIERRTRDIDEGLEDLVAAIQDAPEDCTAEQLCAHLADTLTSPDHDDDVCILVLRRA